MKGKVTLDMAQGERDRRTTDRLAALMIDLDVIGEDWNEYRVREARADGFRESIHSLRGDDIATLIERAAFDQAMSVIMQRDRQEPEVGA